MGRGGPRIGAGRKPQPNSVRSRRKAAQSATVLQHPSSSPGTAPVQPIVVDEFDAPDDLTVDERHVWLRQAPHAFKNGTLTKASALAFERYCRVVVLERYEAKSSGVGGANHRGLLKQVNAYELQFMLTPAGKPLVVPAAPKQDEDDEFFGGAACRQ